MTDWYTLFDTGEMQHVVRMVRSGDPDTSHVLLHTLIPMIDAYLADARKGHGSHIGISAAMRFRDSVQRFGNLFSPDEIERQWIERCEREGTSEDNRNELKVFMVEGMCAAYSRLLRERWSYFIATGAGYLMYHDKPQQAAVRAKASRARGARKESVREEAIRRFDPGPVNEKNPSIKYSRTHRAATIIERACKAHKEGEFADFALLPKAETLRRHLKAD